MKMKLITNKNRMVRGFSGVCAALALSAGISFAPGAALDVRAEETQDFVMVQMPGFVVEQWKQPRFMVAAAEASVHFLPDQSAQTVGGLTSGQPVKAWGRTDTGWYLVENAGVMGYIWNENASFATAEQLEELQAQAASAEAAARQAAALAAKEAQIAAAAAKQPAIAAGVVFIGDSRMVSLKETVEKNLGTCPAAVIAKNGSRYEWFRDSAVSQADNIIGNGSRVVINMGVNDLGDADKYAELVNYWAAVWTRRGAQVYYASVNPVWNNSYGMSEERVEQFNNRLKGQLIPQITWLDSHSYLMQSGVHATDGVHYKDDTNLVLYNYYMTMIGAV